MIATLSQQLHLHDDHGGGYRTVDGNLYGRPFFSEHLHAENVTARLFASDSLPQVRTYVLAWRWQTSRTSKPCQSLKFSGRLVFRNNENYNWRRASNLRALSSGATLPISLPVLDLTRPNSAKLTIRSSD